MWSAAHQEWPDLTKETWESIVASSASTIDFEVVLKYEKTLPLAFMSMSEYTSVFVDAAPDGWREFRRRWPHVRELLWLSWPGVSPSGDQALLYVESSAGALGGSGRLVLMALVDGVWVVRGTHQTWMS